MSPHSPFPHLKLIAGASIALALGFIAPAQAAQETTKAAPPASQSTTLNTKAVSDVALAPDALLNSARWQRLEGAAPQGQAQASWRRVNEQTVAVRGALSTPLAVGSPQRAHIRGQLRFYVPASCPDWTSVSLAFYGSNNTRTYAMAVFKKPNQAIGEGELQIEGSTRINFKFQPAKWYTLSLQLARKTLSFKVWPDGDTEPAQWQIQAGVSNAQVDRVGVRTYGADEVEVSSLTLSGKSGQTHRWTDLYSPNPFSSGNRVMSICIGKRANWLPTTSSNNRESPNRVTWTKRFGMTPFGFGTPALCRFTPAMRRAHCRD